MKETGNTAIEVQIDNLELGTAVANDLHIFQYCGGFAYKISIACFIENKDGVYLRFCGDRPFDNEVNWNTFKILAEIGQKIADYRFSLESNSNENI